MRKSILLALVAALALALGLSSLAVAGQGGAETSAKRAHEKGKKKGRRCRGKGKKGKRCKATAGWPLRPGTYQGQDGIELRVMAGGKMASIVLGDTSGGGPTTCIPIPLELSKERATSTAKRFKAGGKSNPAFGGSGKIRWVIEVNPRLRYKLTLDSSLALPEQPPCDKPGARFSGALEKTG